MKVVCRILVGVVLFVSLVFNAVFIYEDFISEKKVENIEKIEIAENVEIEKAETDNSEIKVSEDLEKKVDLEPVQVEKLVPTVVLAPSAGLNLFGRDEKMHKLSSLSKGDVFNAVFIDDNLDSKLVADEKYIHGVNGNLDYWIFADYLAVNATPSLVIEKASVYSDKSLTIPKGVNISFATIVATSKEADSTQNKNAAKVFWYDKSASKVLEGFIDAEKISSNKDDAIVAGIIEKLRVTTRAVPRNELFKKAFALNPSPKMKKILQAEQVEKIEYDYDEVVKSLSKVNPGQRYRVNVEELMTVDQSKDPFKD